MSHTCGGAGKDPVPPMLSSPMPSITQLLTGAVGIVVALSGLLAATTRSVAILWRLPPETVDRITAAAFLIGVVVATVILLAEQTGG